MTEPVPVLRLADVPVARCDLPRAVDVIERAVRDARAGGGRPFVVFTPNIHHVALLRQDPSFRRAYARADLVLPDGWPVALTVRLATGEHQPRVAGSDLVPALCAAAAERRLSVGFVGGRPGSAEGAAHHLRLRHPELDVAVVEPAPRGFDEDPRQLEDVIRRIAAGRADVLFVGLGAPKQELWIARHAEATGAAAIVAVGAAIDFEAGAVPRAPEAFRRLRLEWLYRLAREPVRLLPRYATSIGPFLGEAAPAVARARQSGSSSPTAGS